MADEISERIIAKIEGYGHADWCTDPCYCSPGATQYQLADAIRGVLDVAKRTGVQP